MDLKADKVNADIAAMCKRKRIPARQAERVRHSVVGWHVFVATRWQRAACSASGTVLNPVRVDRVESDKHRSDMQGSSERALRFDAADPKDVPLIRRERGMAGRGGRKVTLTRSVNWWMRRWARTRARGWRWRYWKPSRGADLAAQASCAPVGKMRASVDERVWPGI